MVTLVFCLQGKAPKQIHALLRAIFQEHAPKVKNRLAQFKRGDFSTCVAPCHERPKTVTTPEIIDQIQELILEHSRITAKSVAEKLGVSFEQVGSTINEVLYMWKLSAKWFPKCLNADQKRQLCFCLKNFGDFRLNQNGFLSRLVTMGDTSLYHYDPETKQQSMEWGHSGVPRQPQKFRMKNSAGTFLASIFWDEVCTLLIDCLPKGHNINPDYYPSLLVQMKDILKEKAEGR